MIWGGIALLAISIEKQFEAKFLNVTSVISGTLYLHITFRRYPPRFISILTWSSQSFLVCHDNQGYRHDECQKVHQSNNLLPAETQRLGQCIEPRHVEKIPGDTERQKSVSLLFVPPPNQKFALMELS